MKQKLYDKILKEGHAETNRYVYKVFGSAIWRKPKHWLVEWEKIKEIKI